MHGAFARLGEKEFMLSLLEAILGSIFDMSSCAYAKTSLYTWRYGFDIQFSHVSIDIDCASGVICIDLHTHNWFG